MKGLAKASVVLVCLLVGFGLGCKKSEEADIVPPVEQAAPAAEPAPAAAAPAAAPAAEPAPAAAPAAEPMAPVAPEPAPYYAPAASGAAMSDEQICSIFKEAFPKEKHGRITECKVSNTFNIGSRWIKAEIKGKWVGSSILGTIGSGSWYDYTIEISSDGTEYRNVN